MHIAFCSRCVYYLYMSEDTAGVQPIPKVDAIVQEDLTKGISHMPLSDKERMSPLVTVKDLANRVTLAFGRWYQEEVRKGGGTPDTSNRVILAAAEKGSETVGEALLHGGAERAKKQVGVWENALKDKMKEKYPDFALPDNVKQQMEKALAVGFVGVNFMEATVLMTAGQEPYKKLLNLEQKGGVVDWAGGGDAYDVGGGTEVGYTGPTDSPGGSYADADNFWDDGNWTD